MYSQIVYIFAPYNKITTKIQHYMTLSKEERKKLRECLPRGAQSQIAKELGVSRQSICLYLKGKSNSLKVERALMKIYLDLSEDYKRLKEILNEE